jgi:N-acetylglucosaminyl-diphospho-decaprenol L-rhamnosyltransferase
VVVPLKLLTIIVNYKTAELTIDALASVAGEMAANPAFRLTVVENDSQDGSAERIETAIASNGWGGWARLIRAERNGGFAYGNNVAIHAEEAERGRPTYVHLLNPDTVVRPGAIGALVEFMDSHLEVGIAGSRLEEPDGRAQVSAFRFPGVLSELEEGMRLGVVSRMLERHLVALPIPDKAAAVDWVAGASMIIRDRVFEAIGLMDEHYFMYYEEVDFTLRAKRAGWPCWYVPSSRVVHLVGKSSGVTDPRKVRRRRPDYWFDSRRRYFLNNLGAVGAGLADLAYTAGHLTFRMRRVVQRKPQQHPERFLRDFVRHSVFARGFQR